MFGILPFGAVPFGSASSSGPPVAKVGHILYPIVLKAAKTAILVLKA